MTLAQCFNHAAVVPNERLFRFANLLRLCGGGFKSTSIPLVWHYGGMIEYVWNVWKQSEGKQGAKQMIGMIETMGKTAYDTGAMLGAFKENLTYIAKYDAVCDAGGAVLLERQ